MSNPQPVIPSGAMALSPSQIQTVKTTIAKDTNDGEFNLFIEVAKRSNLDPFRKHIIPLVFSKRDPSKRRMSIVVTQDGLRVIASRCKDYRPAEEEPEFTFDAKFKGPTNPLGLVKATTTLWKQDAQGKWHPVKGWAYWDEFAPIADEWGYDEESGKRKPTGKKVLDESGNWARMPRIMLAKCATMQALRAGWPEQYGGLVAEEEVDKQRFLDLTATEIIEKTQEEARQIAIGAKNDEFPFIDHEGRLTFLAAGSYPDAFLRFAHNCTEVSELSDMLVRNREGMNRFWAKHKGDALELKAQLEKREAELKKNPVPA